jgi:hypothetical protein
MAARPLNGSSACEQFSSRNSGERLLLEPNTLPSPLAPNAATRQAFCRMRTTAFILTLLLATASLLAEPPIRPDPKLTPGDALEVTREDICTPGY